MKIPEKWFKKLLKGQRQLLQATALQQANAMGMRPDVFSRLRGGHGPPCLRRRQSIPPVMMDNPRLRGGFGGIGDEEGFDELEDPMTGEGPAEVSAYAQIETEASNGGMGGWWIPRHEGHAADGKVGWDDEKERNEGAAMDDMEDMSDMIGEEDENGGRSAVEGIGNERRTRRHWDDGTRTRKREAIRERSEPGETASYAIREAAGRPDFR